VTGPLHTDHDLAERYGRSREWVQEQCRAKAWPHLRAGKAYRFTDEQVSAIDALLTVDAPAEPAPVTPTPAKDNPWDRKGRRA
jgi:hypothetical protein